MHGRRPFRAYLVYISCVYRRSDVGEAKTVNVTRAKQEAHAADGFYYNMLTDIIL